MKSSSSGAAVVALVLRSPTSSSSCFSRGGTQLLGGGFPPLSATTKSSSCSSSSSSTPSWRWWSPAPVSGLSRLPLQCPQTRAFASSASEEKEVHEDSSLLGRYGLALFRSSISRDALDKVFADLDMLRCLLSECPQFRLFIETPGITAAQKLTVISDMKDKHGLHEVTVNFLKVLLENRRLSQLDKMVNSFEAYYRKHKGEIKCTVTSAKALTTAQQKDVMAAMQKRCGVKAKLIVDYQLQPSIVGGLVVRLDERVLDFSVQTRVESLKGQLMEPVA
eukprot:GHVS01028668.1.p1 GENE.GHVS01028668.1~~GHVS01028668.1.p1  ORF type:complete len:294 (+),score=71.86 GHVS01028668.1:50-883(+)